MTIPAVGAPKSLRWLKYEKEPWHGWVAGARASLCGEITLLDLRTTPAAATASCLPTGARDILCPACAEKAGVHGMLGSGSVAAMWEGLIRKQFRRFRVRPAAKEDIEDFADLLSRLGPPASPEAARVWRYLTMLIFKPHKSRRTDKTGKQRLIATLPSFKSIVTRLPPDLNKLRHVAATIELWSRITGKNPDGERFNPDKVVQTILEIPDAAAYVHRQKETLESSNLALVFHPTTLSRARKDPALRGLWWDGDSGAPNSDLLDGVEIVTE